MLADVRSLELVNFVPLSVGSHSIVLVRSQELVGVPLVRSRVLAVLRSSVCSTQFCFEPMHWLERLLLRDFWFSGSKLQSQPLYLQPVVSLRFEQSEVLVYVL